MNWLRFLYPRISLRTCLHMVPVVLIGALVAGAYGVIHDQVTYSISEEYFTRNKFAQFHYARPSVDSPRVFVGIIGFLATWWVGAFAGWILGRSSISGDGALSHPRWLACSFGIVILTSVFAALGGWCWGQWRKSTGYAEGWLRWMDSLGVVDREAFMTVGYIHNASYLGGCLGLVLGVLYLKKVALRH